MSIINEITQKYFVLPDGAKLAYDLHGEDHLNRDNKEATLPLILIGGVGSTKVDWARLLPHLSEARTVLTFDHRGIGLSKYSTPANNDELTIESMTRDVVALIESFGWQDVEILGLSMGGVLLQQLLLLHRHPTTPTKLPFRVRHAVFGATFASPLPLGDNPEPPPWAAVSGQALTNEQKKELVRPAIEASLGAKWIAASENKKRLEVWLENSIINRPFLTIMRQGKMLEAFSFVDHLKFIEPGTEILVIHGIDDVVVPCSMAEEILRACPQARLVSIGSKRGQVPSYAFGHVWYEYFEGEVWAGVLDSFLNQSPAARLA